MMTEPINLNNYRKAKARAMRRVSGDENAAKFGRSKDEKTLASLRNEKTQRDHDGHEKDT